MKSMRIRIPKGVGRLALAYMRYTNVIFNHTIFISSNRNRMNSKRYTARENTVSCVQIKAEVKRIAMQRLIGMRWYDIYT